MSENKRSPKPKVVRTATWIDASLVKMAKQVAVHRDTKLVNVIESILRASLTRSVAKL
jgi:hypothetical protein